MLYRINDGSFRDILSHFDFEIHGTEKIAVVGKNGAGKTTLLKLIAGELTLDRDDKSNSNNIETSRKLTIGMLSQQAFADDSHTVEEELLCACPQPDMYSEERYEYEREYDSLFTGLGFKKADKIRKISEFSGGEQTKIALIRLLLEKPDILLLDEPTNHLDMHTTEWLEDYLKKYDKAVVAVSHDRFFLDRIADVVYEVSGRKLTRYVGNYTMYREQKIKDLRIRERAYKRHQEERIRLERLIERFKHKPNKAAFARAKRKVLERMPKLQAPLEDDVHIFTGDIDPLIHGSKTVFEAEHLKFGYDRPLLEITLRIRRGQKIAILGDNGAGKSTFLKTIAGILPPLGGKYSLGANTTIGYFDQHSINIDSEKSVVQHFHDIFMSLTDKEVRSILGAYLFSGKDASKRVSILSGGEKARLVLAELLQSRPNFMLLDEPTNHMDIQAKETLESAFLSYRGTLLFVSHDRYFVKQVADAILIFEDDKVMYYPFGYEHYLAHSRPGSKEELSAKINAEEQALIAGLKSVPKAERHRLKEISAEEAYADWQFRPVRESLYIQEEKVSRLSDAINELEEKYMNSEEFWNNIYDNPTESDEKEIIKLRQELEQEWALWNEKCMEWFDVWNLLTDSNM